MEDMLGQYNDVLGKAWKFTKKNRFMWWFGLFAAFLGGNGGEYEMLVRNLFDFKNREGLYSLFNPDSLARKIDAAQTFFSTFGAGGWVAVLVVVIVALFFIWIVLISQSALIHAAGQNLSARAMTFDRMFTAGRAFVGRAFVLNLLAKAIVVVLFVLAALPMVVSMDKNPSPSLALSLDLATFVIMVPVAIIISFLLKYALSYVVLKNKSVGDSIGLAWRLFTKHWLVTAELALFIFALNVVVGLGMVVILILFTLPIFFLSVVLAGAGLVSAFWMLVMVAALVFFAIIFMLGAGFSTFQWAAWTELFIELTNARRESMILGWIRLLLSRISTSRSRASA